LHDSNYSNLKGLLNAISTYVSDSTKVFGKFEPKVTTVFHFNGFIMPSSFFSYSREMAPLLRTPADSKQDHRQVINASLPPRRLNELKIPNLELRRLHVDLITCYKIVSGLVDVNFDDFFQHSTAVTTRGHPFKLFKCHSDVNVRKSFLVNVL